MPYMESGLDILNAVQYDIGVPLPAIRTTRGAKRKLLSMTTETEETTETANMTRPRTMATDFAVTDLLSSVDVAPPSVAMTLRHDKDDMEGPPPKGGRKPSKRAGRKGATTTTTVANIVDTVESDDGDDDGEEADAEKKRARGRPRIDVKDVTAADRRRTQIRLAQRAYRSRKERAIVSLEKRVHSLKEANEAMSNAFMNLHDFAVSRGLLDQHPDLAQQLRQTTEVFLEMARQSSADEEMEDHDEDEANHSQSNSSSNNANNTNTHADDAVRAFEMKQQAIIDAVKTFGYQTEQDIANKNSMNNVAPAAAAPAVLSQQMMLPPQATSMRQANTLQHQLYGGIVMHQPLDLDNSSSGGPFDQQTANLVDKSFRMAMNGVNSVTNSPVGAAPVGSFYTGSGSGNGTTGTGTGTGTGSNDISSSSNSALSVSPASGRNMDVGLSNQFTFDGHSFSLFPDYPSPPAQQQTIVPTSTCDLGPHLADTDAFISTAAIGSPYASLEPPTNRPSNVSFGRRLRRYAIESAYHLVTSSDPPAEVFTRAFGFCIMFEPVEQIRDRLLRSLEAPFLSSKFTRWELPFVSQNPDAADAPPAAAESAPAPSVASHSSLRSTQSTSSRGSNRIPNNSNSDHRGTSVRPVTPRIHVTLPGFEGAFYDCDETEMYLQQRGVHIPPDSDSVIVEVDDADFALDDATTVVSGGTLNSSVSGRSANTSNTANTANTANTSQSGERSGQGKASGPGMFDYLSPDLISSKTAVSARNGNAMDWTGPGVDGGGVAGTIAAAAAANTARGNGGALDEDASFMSSFMYNPMFGLQPPAQPDATFPQRRLLSLDVDKFLAELVRRGTCLGQTPGFRALDVNEAFWSATRNASSM